ncbi:MAG TPA: MFS transporter [Armatimonadota bacterium]|nr:MFS transporter [Armatimonadota bacterium]
MLEKAVPKEARDAYRRESWGALLGGVYTGAIFPFIGFIARDSLHASVALIGLMTAAPFIGNVFALFYANAMEGKAKMPYVVWSQVIARALFLLILFAKTPLSFALIVTAVQVIASAAGPAYAAILKEIYPDDYRGRIMAYIRVGLAFVTLVSTLLVGRLLKHVGFNYIFAVAGLFGVAAALAFGTIKTAPVDPEGLDQKVSTLRFLRNTFAIFKEDREYAWFALSIFTYGFGSLIAAPLYPVFQVDRLHISAIQVAMLSNTSTAIWMLAYLYWGRYIDMRSPLKATVVNVLLASLVPLNYFLARDVWMLLPAAVISGVTMGGVELSYFNSILHFAKPGRESHYQALHSFSLGIRGAIAPFCGAAIASLFRSGGIDVRYVFLVAMALMLLGAGLQVIGVKHRY